MPHLRHNLADLHFGEALAMSDGLLVLLLALELEDDDFVGTVAAHNGGGYPAAGDEFAAVLDGCLYGKFYFAAHVPGQLFNADHVTGRNPVLFTACFDNRVHVILGIGAGHTECVEATESKN